MSDRNQRRHDFDVEHKKIKYKIVCLVLKFYYIKDYK